MKNYIDLLSNDEIKEFILKCLKQVNWNSCAGNLNEIDDIVIKRNNDVNTLEIYFSNINKNDIHDEYVHVVSDLMGIEIKSVYEILYFDSFELSGCNFDNYRDNGLFYENDTDDLTTYWLKTLYKKFDKEYIEDYKEFKLNDLKEFYEEEKRKIDEETNDLTM